MHVHLSGEHSECRELCRSNWWMPTAPGNFALLLEYLESEFYTRAVAGGALSGELLNFATIVRDHELAHVEFLRNALGAAAIEKPTFDFRNTTTDAEAFAATAIVLEDTGVAAYNGQGPRLRRRTLPAAASVVSVEARHAAWIRRAVAVLLLAQAEVPDV